MMKFFRKYTKHMLAVFMALLLVVWLGGDALQALFERDNSYEKTVVFEAFGKEVKMMDLAAVTNQAEIGSRLIPQLWHKPWLGILMGTVDQQLLQAINFQARDRLSADEWYLLDAEASRNGVHVSQEQVDQVKAAMPAEALNALRESQKLSVRQIDDALRAYLRIEEAARRATSAVSVSEADIRDFVRNVTEKIDVDMVIVDPQKLIDPAYQPTDDELKAQFEKHKNEAPAGPGNFGYQLPEATQVEFIEISVDALAKTQTVSEDEGYEYWTAHKAEFKKPATQPVTTAPATRPEQPKPYDSFHEAKPQVVEKLQHNKAVQVADRVAGELIRQLTLPWAAAPTTQPGGYKQPPASEIAGDLYEKTMAVYQERYPGVLSYGRTQLGSADALGSHPKLGRARAFAGTSQPVQFSEAAFLVAGLKPEKGTEVGTARLYRNVFETSVEPLSDTAGNVFVFRNIAVRPAQAPDSFEEVRNKLVEDLRQIRAGEQAEQIAKSLADRAKQSNLKTAFQSDAELAQKLTNGALIEPEPFSRQNINSNPRGGMPQVYPSFIPSLGYDPEAVKAAFDLAGRATTTQPTAVATHKDNRQRWIVMEYQRTLPVTRDEYNSHREIARQLLLTERRVRFVLDWFAEDSIHARTGWRSTEPSAPPKEGTPAQAKAS